MLAQTGQVATYLSWWMELVMVHWQGRLAWVTAVASLYMAEAELLAEPELAVRLVVVLVHVLQEVRSQGRREWMRKTGVDHNRSHMQHHRCDCQSRKTPGRAWAYIVPLLLPLPPFSRLKCCCRWCTGASLPTPFQSQEQPWPY